MAKNYYDEYVVSLKPDVDLNEWKQTSGSIQGILDKTLLKPFHKALDLTREKLKQLQLDLKKQKEAGQDTSQTEAAIQQTTYQLNQQQQQFNVFSSSLVKGSAYLATFVAAVKAASDAAQQMADKAKDVSNQFISQSSVQIDSSVRDTMAKFGVDATTAQSITSSAEVLGYDISEYAKWTVAQRQAFSSLMKEYQSGIDSINPTKLQQFNDVVQEYQLTQAKFQLKFKLALTEMLAESDGLTHVLDTLSETMESITTIMSSDGFKAGFDLLMGIVNGILKFATTPINWLGKLMGSNSSSVTTNTANINTTVNTNGNINEEQLAVDIGLSVQNAMSGR